MQDGRPIPAPLHSNRCNDALIEPSNVEPNSPGSALNTIDSDRKVLIDCLDNKDKREEANTS